jgi:hypothetical protein
MNPPIPGDPLIRFVAALLLGALVGLEREFSSRDHEGSIPFAGIRTFPIISALGFAAALASQYVTWSFAVAFLTIGALSVTAYWRRSVRETDAGATTQITALVVFLLGGLCYWGELPIAATTGVVLTLLLSYKPALHKAVRVLEAEDIHALLKFALISAVILPALPNQDIGPGGVFNEPASPLPACWVDWPRVRPPLSHSRAWPRNIPSTPARMVGQWLWQPRSSIRGYS